MNLCGKILGVLLEQRLTFKSNVVINITLM